MFFTAVPCSCLENSLRIEVSSILFTLGVLKISSGANVVGEKGAGVVVEEA